MVSSNQPTDLSEVPSSEMSLGAFLRDLSSSLRELNGSVVLMAQSMVDGVVTEALQSAADTDAFVVVPESMAPVTTASADAPATAAIANPPMAAVTAASQTSNLDPVDMSVHTGTPPESRWYAITVGRNPGIFQGSQYVTSNIERIPGGQAVRCENESQARNVFDHHLRSGLVKQVEFIVNETPITFDDYHSTHQ
ncbi:hypothetical protein BDZ97DRAFT_2078483 [Flammula alnicola]|nr:hypothetical protein BDZ97DRAFT_2082063 [Flammula alnicola]KAF8958729.1 hypothetical protein BDZ97DRAFT_2078483 [Flammula alnicola]